MASMEAIFTGCNRELQISSYSSAFKILAFGSKNSISICEKAPSSTTFSISKTLNHHESQITTVQWLPFTNLLVSTSEDKTIKIYEYSKSNNQFKLFQSLENYHDAGITTIGLLNEDNNRMFVTGGADGKINIWQQDSGNGLFKLIGLLNATEGFYQLSISIIQITNDQYIFFVGGTKQLIFVYSFDLTKLNDDGLVNINSCASLSGHEDWIKCITVKKLSVAEYLIASGSQDKYIRLWKLLLNEYIDTSDEQDSNRLRLLSNKQYKFTISDSTKCSINFDAIIMGHDDWISDLIWHPTDLKLLSSSADTSIMIWEPDMVSGIWISKIRLGDLSIKGASTATGSSGGFWSALWIFENDEEFILTNGKTGSFRYWKLDTGNGYVQQPCLTGPIKEVTDVCWSPDGEYLLSTSLDQTTRLYSKNLNSQNNNWAEFSRPQIHGYDMICIKPITNNRFISGGDEKIMRVFDEPKSVAKLLNKFSDIPITEDSLMPESASLPVLGLSNKAESDDQQQYDGEYQPTYGKDVEEQEESKEAGEGSGQILESLTTSPLEDHLQRHTLWPEIEKLYGHGYEVTTIDVSPDLKYIASVCRSNNANHAGIKIFEIVHPNGDNENVSFRLLEKSLNGHELTITRVKFSPDNKYLVSVSRDRKFTLWKRNEEEFTLIKVQEKAHSRIIWDACWFPIDQPNGLFVTGSRDRQVKLWNTNGDGSNDVILVNSTKLSNPITALDSYQISSIKLSSSSDSYCLLAVGLENGQVLIFAVSATGEFNLLKEVDQGLLPSDKISRLSFSTRKQQGGILLAIGSVDSSVRILSIDINELI